MKVVILDDSKTVRLTIQILLEELGLNEREIFLFSEGEKALQFIMDNSADIIFSDIQMPGMDGFEFVEKLLGYSPHYAADLCIISAEERSNDILKMKNLGAKHFLRKPIDTERFNHYLKSKIAHHKQDNMKGSEMSVDTGIDYDALAAEMGIKPKHIPMLIKSFLDESSTLLEKLKQAIADKNYPLIARNVHSLKGSAGNMKLQDVYEMGKSMESAANRLDTEFGYEECFSKIEERIKKLKK